MALHAEMGPPNDEARAQHRLYGSGLEEVHWLGVVRHSELVARLRPMWSPVGGGLRLHPMHYVVLSKECVIEVVAADIELFRIGGAPSDAAAKSLGPELDR